MFLAEDRLPIVRRMILASTPRRGGARRSRSSGWPSAPTSARSSRPWTACRSPSGCSTRRCTSSCPTPRSWPSRRPPSGSPTRSGRLYEAAKPWHEYNPMLGTRGVRLGVIKPGLYAMQVRALMEAAIDRVADGGHPVVEIMIPLTVTREELALARSWVEEAVADGRGGHRVPGRVPWQGQARGAHRDHDRDPAGRPAGRRDRRGGRLLLLRHQRPDPDDLRLQPRRRRGPDDVGLPRAGTAASATRSRSSTPTGSASWCASASSGAGPPARRSRSGCAASTAATPSPSPSSPDAGLDYVSCSPFRVPIARLAAPRRCWPD